MMWLVRYQYSDFSPFSWPLVFVAANPDEENRYFSKAYG